MGDYPECERMAEAAKVTGPIGEFLDWLKAQGIHLMTWREDLTDSRPTDLDCRNRTREHRYDSCWPTPGSETGSADYYSTHCLHWHGRKRADGDNEEDGTCCWCGLGQHYEITGLRAWVSDPRSFEQLLADWAGIDLKKVEAERRQILAGLAEANARAGQ